MTLIQKQDQLVAQLEPIYFSRIAQGKSGMDGQASGLKSRAKRLHAEMLMKEGYTKDEAWQSASDCEQVAYRNADHKAYMAGMGVPA